MAKKYKVDYYSFLGFILFAVFIVFVWRFYYGYYILYPFTILGTWFHEMGHGLMSIIVGGTFEYLEIFNNGSGLAHSSYYDSDFYFNKNIALAMVTAAGLFGPPFVGSVLILMSKSFKKSKFILYILSISMLLSVAIWVRTPVGVIVILSLGALFLFIAIKAKSIIIQLAVQLIGVIACVNTYRQIAYLYTEKVTVGGLEESFSDTGSIASRLGMTYSFWGTLILIVSFVMLVYSLYLRNRTRVPA
ncbi:MAG: M50 family metallopeptidase [Flavobacteriales bacterium]